jgi:hypothetical protein
VAGEDSFSAFDGFVPLLAVTRLGHREIWVQTYGWIPGLTKDMIENVVLYFLRLAVHLFSAMPHGPTFEDHIGNPRFAAECELLGGFIPFVNGPLQVRYSKQGYRTICYSCGYISPLTTWGEPQSKLNKATSSTMQLWAGLSRSSSADWWISPRACMVAWHANWKVRLMSVVDIPWASWSGIPESLRLPAAARAFVLMVPSLSWRKVMVS